MTKPRRDPAPSRLKYRLQRLWLRPIVRRSLQVGPPMALATAAVFYVWMTPELQRQIRIGYEDLRSAIVNREEFRVQKVEVKGASPELKALVSELAALDLPKSTLDLDVADLRQRVETLPSVSEAAVRVGPGGVLQINLDERVPEFVWRVKEDLSVLDGKGVVLGRIVSREDQPRLPLVVGPGADEAIAEAKALYSVASPVAPRIRALQRVGGRRWNVILDKDQTLLLPEENPITALRAIMDLHQDAEVTLLERDIVAVDFRDPERPVLRLGPFGQGEIKRLQGLSRGGAE